MSVSPPADARPHSVSTEWLLAPAGHPAFVFAHQDDETVAAGCIMRILVQGERGTFIWWTNGDGLAPAANMDPEAYARMRIAECSESLRRLGGSDRQKVDLESSEIENYRRLTHVAEGGRLRDQAFEYFLAEADRLEGAIRKADPDRVFVLAWQGGQPEHDLTHILTMRAVRKLRLETGRPIPVVGCPAYEYLIFCPMRFSPWYRGDVRYIYLSPEEMARKRYVLEAYPSQLGCFSKFEWVIRGLGWLSALRLKPFTPETFLSREEFGVVDPDLDYTRSTHRFEFLNYVLDDFEGIPVRYDTMVRPLAAFLLR
jgi:LmbE family N-acetylglucosaminyl deacetylase